MYPMGKRPDAKRGTEWIDSGVHAWRRKVDVRLPGRGNSNSHGARLVHLIITMITWFRSSRLSIKDFVCMHGGRVGTREALSPFPAEGENGSNAEPLPPTCAEPSDHGGCVELLHCRGTSLTRPPPLLGSYCRT